MPIFVAALIVSMFTGPVFGAGVNDPTGLFSADAAAHAQKELLTIQSKTGNDVLFEVFEQIPTDLKTQYTPANKDSFFAGWARDRAKQSGADIYVLINRQPAHLKVAVSGRLTQDKKFTAQQRDELANILLAEFRQRAFDEGLATATTFLAGTLPQQQQGWSPNLGLLKWGALGLMAVFIVVILMRNRRRIRPEGAPPQADYPGQNPVAGPPLGGGMGGFGRGMMGGIAGALAGNWLYDRFLGSGSAHGAAAAPHDAPPESPSSADYDVSGGDFGSDGGFGDSGGDFGGGDF